VDFEPYTPSHHFAGGKNGPGFRTKLKIASDLVELAVQRSVPFAAVVADSFYGEEEGFKQRLGELGAGYVLALKPSHAWWHREDEEVGSPWEAALVAGEGWQDERHPGDWVKVRRSFRDGHEERWWALEVKVGPYGPDKDRRAVVATTDPEKLPDKQTWYLRSNLPHPGSEGVTESELLLAPADLAEIVRLYGLRMWVEQSYKQVKHALGWSDYQVRGDLSSMRRHWQLVCLAFSLCWWEYGGLPIDEEPSERRTPSAEMAGRGKKETLGILAGGFESGKGVSGAVGNAVALLEGVHRAAPAEGAKSAA
jgi:SRSO17 transposase